MTDTRQVIGIGKIGPSRTVQEAQWEIVIGNIRKALGKEKSEVAAQSHIQEFKYNEEGPMERRAN